MYKCEECNITYDKFQDKANHVRWFHIGIKEETREKISKISKKRVDSTYGVIITDIHECSNYKCNNAFEIKYREGKKKEKYYCCRSCANSRGDMSDDMKKQISLKIKKKWEDGIFDDLKNLENNKRFSSKNERMIVDHFIKKYPDDGWKSGGGLKYENIRISRDMYSDKLKVCFEYDGIWHFKDIKGQLERKKIVDSKLEKWCIEKGYRIIRIQEEYFKDLSQIEDLIYKKEDVIIKIGNNY